MRRLCKHDQTFIKPKDDINCDYIIENDNDDYSILFHT